MKRARPRGSGRKFLDPMMGNLERIKKDGDTIARLMEKLNASCGPNPLPERLWASKEEALLDLKDTAEILKTFAHVIKERPELVGPPERW